MGDNLDAAVVDTCRTVYAKTKSIDAAHEAAEAMYQMLRPEISERHFIRSRVSLIIGRAIVDSGGTFWHGAAKPGK